MELFYRNPQLEKFDIDHTYKPRKDLIIADAPSRAYLIQDDNNKSNDEKESQVCLVRLEVNTIDDLF